jgi:hypothetical protein
LNFYLLSHGLRRGLHSCRRSAAAQNLYGFTATMFAAQVLAV